MDNAEASDASGEEEEESLRRGRVGMWNLGNTCYLNASLSCLSHVPQLVEYMLGEAEQAHMLVNLQRNTQRTDVFQLKEDKEQLVHQTRALLQALWVSDPDEGRRGTAEHHFVSSVRRGLCQFEGYQQQDAQEFLLALLVELHDAIKRPSRDCKRDTEEAAEKAKAAAKEERARQKAAKGRAKAAAKSGGAAAAARGGEEDEEAAPASEGRRVIQEESSIISDVFGGKTRQSVTCMECGHVSVTVEDIKDISLAIPDQKQQKKMRQGGAKRDAPDGGDGAEEDEPGLEGPAKAGWLSWLGGGGTRTTVYDCLNGFCSKETLRGEDKFQCDKCEKKTDAEKEVCIERLPESLILHVKRFRYEQGGWGFGGGSKMAEKVEFPLNGEKKQLDMKRYVHEESRGHPQNRVTRYDLVGVVNHHGSMGGGHYTAFAWDVGFNCWIEYDDNVTTRVEEAVVKQSEAYLLFYVKAGERKPPKLKLPKPSAPKFYIPRVWELKSKRHTWPGPVDLSAYMCEHGALAPFAPAAEGRGELSTADLLQPVNQDCWKSLLKEYGGGPQLTSDVPCAVCTRALQELARQRDIERDEITRLDSTESPLWYIISAQWLTQWHDFLGAGPRPGPVSNVRLLEKAAKGDEGAMEVEREVDGRTELVWMRPRRHLKRSNDFRGVNKQVWQFFQTSYSGGPEMPRHAIDIYGEIADEAEE